LRLAPHNACCTEGIRDQNTARQLTTFSLVPVSSNPKAAYQPNSPHIHSQLALAIFRTGGVTVLWAMHMQNN
jgi:hypothetical protein